MWRWQHKNIHKKHLLWAKLFGICFIFHLIFLCWIFCIYHDNSYILSMSVHKNIDYSTPIIFVPCPIPPSTPTIKKTSPAITTQPKPVTKKAAPQTTIIQQKPVVEKTTIIEPKKKTTITDAPKTITQPTKIEPIKIEQIKQDTTPIIPPTKEPKEDAQKTEPAIQKLLPSNAHVSHNYREVEALRCGAQLQKELVQKWKPPIGVSPECMCEISFFVNTKGTIENLKMIKNSGVIMYDISARQALYAMKMPQWTHAKSLIISFKQ
jgi:TonB C terminal